MKQIFCHGECQALKDISEFYITPNGKHYKKCKKCHTKTTGKYKPKDQKPPDHEIRTVKWLNSKGIISSHGKSLVGDNNEFCFTDIVSFGCVKIEVKLIQKDGRIHFTETQIERQDFHIIIIERFQSKYYVFSGDNPCFYENGKLCKVVRSDRILWDESLARIELIEYHFMQERMKRISQNSHDEIKQLELFSP